MMERLTKVMQCDDGNKLYDYSNEVIRNVKDFSSRLELMFQKLAEYEDLEERIGVPLEELAKLCNKHIPKDCQNPNKAIVLTDEDVDRWSEYKNAEEQGMLLRLPCKV